LRRKLEEQQESAELQRAIELQNRRFMGMQLLDLKSRGHHLLGSPVGSPGDGNGGCFNANGNGVHHFENNIQGSVLGAWSGYVLANALCSSKLIHHHDFHVCR
jgi:hypothetical protein